MKKLSLWLSMSVAALFCSVAASGAVDGVRVSDGKESVVFSFMSTPTVTFGDATLYVTSEDGSVEFPMTSEVTFDFVEGSGVGIVKESDVRVRLTGSNLEITGLTDGTLVRVFQTDGRLICSSEADSSGAWSVSVSQLPKTPLVVNAGKNAYKIIIR